MNHPSFEAFSRREHNIAVVGLGYVGLPLAIALARHFSVVGFDVNPDRVRALREGRDRTGEITTEELLETTAGFTHEPEALQSARIIIAAVPTPIDPHRNPDLKPLKSATRTIARHMSPGTVVVYESTVYPGATEEVCVPILEAESGLALGADFTVGYSPERINPGDRVHTLASVMKIVAGSDPDTCELLASIYGAVVQAGIHRAPSIKVAEAAKVIENTQRDLNIALMNELSAIFGRMGIDTLEVLEAAGTKWNFLPFRPGLVGGHCIGVDPYYLTFKAETYGYHPEVILAGRRINDSMGKRVAETCVKLLIRQGRLVNTARVGILGLSFKENVPDLRNTRVIDVVRELMEYGVQVLVSDPLVDPEEAQREYGLALYPQEELTNLDALILAVPHRLYTPFVFVNEKKRFANPGQALLLDVRGCLSREEAEQAGFVYWRL